MVHESYWTHLISATLVTVFLVVFGIISLIYINDYTAVSRDDTKFTFLFTTTLVALALGWLMICEVISIVNSRNDETPPSVTTKAHRLFQNELVIALTVFLTSYAFYYLTLELTFGSFQNGLDGKSNSVLPFQKSTKSIYQLLLVAIVILSLFLGALLLNWLYVAFLSFWGDGSSSSGAIESETRKSADGSVYSMLKTGAGALLPAMYFAGAWWALSDSNFITTPTVLPGAVKPHQDGGENLFVYFSFAMVISLVMFITAWSHDGLTTSNKKDASWTSMVLTRRFTIVEVAMVLFTLIQVGFLSFTDAREVATVVILNVNTQQIRHQTYGQILLDHHVAAFVLFIVTAVLVFALFAIWLILAIQMRKFPLIDDALSMCKGKEVQSARKSKTSSRAEDVGEPQPDVDTEQEIGTVY